MRQLYILGNHTGYRAFEDYYLSMYPMLNKSFNASIIIYDDVNDIPLPISNEIYVFLNNIPQRFVKLYISNRHRFIYFINTEQSTRPIWSMMINQYAKMHLKWCDYDQYQYQVTQKTYLSPTHYLPYQINFNEIKHLYQLQQTPKKYDVAFCAVNQSPKRLNIYNQLQQLGYSLVDVMDWRESRDKVIAESRILINIHYDDTYNIFEHLRCDRWILSGMLVISESSLSDNLLDCKSLLISVPYDQLVTTISKVLAHYQDYYCSYMIKLDYLRDRLMDQRHTYLKKFIKVLENDQ